MGSCSSRDDLVDDEEILLAGRRSESQGLARDWPEVQPDPEGKPDPTEARPSEVPSEADSPMQMNKDAIKKLVQALVRGLALDVSSSSIAMQRCLAKVDRDLTHLSLQDAKDTGSVKIIPLLRLVEVSRVLPPGGRYLFGDKFSVRLRLGPHGRQGPEALTLSLRTAEESAAFVACISASARHLQGQAAWERKPAMDEESVPSTLLRTVEALRDPFALSALQTTAKKPKKALNLKLPMSKLRDREGLDHGLSAKMDEVVPWELRNGEVQGKDSNLS
mmetsp:Transcript_38915/g.70199  ORF Transcript_38915/g.70199 Transcript_38915/m.70199 type:complete len:276 (+) Transcript_38915:35-862(+)|eukprot:CAMPEP_0197651098 /NCGR_PEP_ID=MMETSP1338-20131121/31349_1 /TAXON_ID=43686 ORGANISM="Pelagodinium beii, Strain RCC1491" /NCGR_SAMPLE_ID=MMETSP1338 /ASSEMBLY_ACC=CAM_ASM_000754 /LENGTH=275 /DNA_ID=CAMNT_0043225651 /DNA_START=35 /DNA_END=862 /DNA_ORIENTATION=-